MLSYFSGIDFTQSLNGLIMHQSRYARELLKKFKMVQSNVVATPLQYKA